MLGVGLLAVAGGIFFVQKLKRFECISRLGNGKKFVNLIIRILIVVCPTAIMWVLWGNINAVISLIHLFVFWLVSDGIFYIIRKIRKKPFRRYYAGAVAILFTIGWLSVGW